MKKLILLSLLGLFFLAGCKNTIQNPDPVVQEQKPLETVLPPDTWTYPQPTIHIKTGTWMVIGWIDADLNWDYEWFTLTEDWNNYKAAIITWYIYTYTYKDLWIKVTTPPLYEPYFFEKTNESIYARYKNMIYPSRQWNTWWWDYIAVFEKNSQTPLSQEITNNHLGTWCKIETGIFDKKTTHYESMIGFDVVYIIDKDSQTACSVYDTQFPQREMPLVFVMNPDKPEKYYKLAIGDGCAPGPCTIFWTIEFF